MNNEFGAFDATPILTLDPFEEEKKNAFPVMEAEPEKPVFDENVLSPEERQAAAQFAEKIDLTNSQMILQYGAGSQKKMADFTENALSNVRSKDLGEVGDLLAGVVKELKGFDEEEEEKGFFGFIKILQ